MNDKMEKNLLEMPRRRVRRHFSGVLTRTRLKIGSSSIPKFNLSENLLKARRRKVLNIKKKTKKLGKNKLKLSDLEVANLKVDCKNSPNTYDEDPDTKFLKKKRKNPFSLKSNNLQVSFLKAYKQDSISYYNINDLLELFKKHTGLNFEVNQLKDEENQEFKENTNNFLKNYTKIYKKSHVLIENCHVPLFYEILSKFMKVNYNSLLDLFNKLILEEETIKIRETLEYIRPTCFISDSTVKIDEQQKKKPGPYLKYRTLPKWHFHALDLLSQISNSRKSFIFSKFPEDEELDIINKKKLDLETIKLKLKLKIYNDIYEVVDDLLKMIKNASTTLNKNLKKFCKMTEVKIKKTFQRLKDENKI